MSPSTDVYDHLIVGGGIAGLSYAWRRAREGRRVLVLEAAETVGGSRRTRHEAGYTWDETEEAVLGEAPALEALLASLPASPRLVEGESLGAPLRASPTGLKPLPRRTPPRPARGRTPGVPNTLEALARRALGEPLLAALVGPAAAALHGVTPDRLGGVETAPGLALASARGRGRPRRVRVRLLEDGLDALTTALEAVLEDRVRVGTEVGAVRRGAGSLEAETISGDRVSGREIALAVPARTQARLLAGLAPHPAEVLAALPRATVVSAALGVPARALASLPPCPGFLVPARDARIQAVLLTSRIARARAPEGRALVQVRLGGPAHAGVAALTDDLVRAIAETDLGGLLGAAVRPDLVACRRLDVPAPTPGWRGRLASLTGRLGARGIRLFGAHVLGIGLEGQARAGVPVPGPLPDGVELV